jgi:hypothetical protein
MPVHTRPGDSDQTCELCGRVRPLSFHHLIPRTLHSNKWFRKRFDRMEMATRGADLCRECHEFIHNNFSEKELGRHLNTVAALKNNKRVRRFVAWISERG